MKGENNMENVKDLDKLLETASLFSYKGGVGRTYLTVQLARCLAALGKKVVVVDFDFDAPGVPGSFKNPHDTGTHLNFYTKVVENGGGLFELVADYIDKSVDETGEDFATFMKDCNKVQLSITNFKCSLSPPY
jgi:hypothetical protein